MPAPLVEVSSLSRTFGSTVALDHVNMALRPGLVYGLVGANGAGKTTLIKHLLGLLRAKSGSVRVFGLDPVEHPVEVLVRIGYLSEDRDLPPWMRIDELMRYTRAFHPNWDPQYADELLARFGLDRRLKVKGLSQGMRAQTALIAAVAHRPELLVLDEPSTGLDAVVRRDILNALIRAVADDGRTAMFSSHLLDEVEQMSDYVFMIDGGRVVVEGTVDDVRARHHLLSVRFDAPCQRPPLFPGALSAEGAACDWSITCNGNREQLSAAVREFGGQIVQARTASLEEIFVARVGRDRLAARGS